MKSVIVMQECRNCGCKFPARYYENAMCYVGACECESDFSPIEGQPSFNEWMDSIRQGEYSYTESASLTAVNLKTMFEEAAENGADELDFYWNLTELHVDVSMVRDYVGDSQADAMQKFCEEHALI